ncbi:hypothetical protein [Croceivirga thetidis]|uniref:Uncharacterized protein n=1 Tax=Croceivirga thetidis TaxID=2721623 RepID=A0ABX1GTS4_9FLAO|nr:hypothetical protein [Croceivirga thetidis]NKI33014.1 hypothetical protein [Croceivirga thetidis]
MNNQYCKVGSTTPITQVNQAMSVLESQYRIFVEKATIGMDSKLNEFFEAKANGLRKILDELV